MLPSEGASLDFDRVEGEFLQKKASKVSVEIQEGRILTKFPCTTSLTLHLCTV